MQKKPKNRYQVGSDDEDDDDDYEDYQAEPVQNTKYLKTGD